MARKGGLPPELSAASQAGLRIFPVKPRDKRPLIKGWQALATGDENQIERWAAEFPGCNWGITTGSESGVFVLDVDGSTGVASLDGLKENNGDWPETLSVLTARGTHYYFIYPNGQELRNSAGRLGSGLDIRAEGGYVLIPPSVHPGGGLYAYAPCMFYIQSAPAWLLEKLTPQWKRESPFQSDKIGLLSEGQRNDGLTRLGGALRRRGADLGRLEAELLQANLRRCKPPLPDGEVLKIAASVARYVVGGPDPLETAWAETYGEVFDCRYERFLALAAELQHARAGLSFALPLERIGELAGCDWTQVRRWRQRAVREGLLHPVSAAIAHRRAAHYILANCPTRGVDVPLVSTISGLVGTL